MPSVTIGNFGKLRVFYKNLQVQYVPTYFISIPAPSSAEVAFTSTENLQDLLSSKPH